MGMRAELDEANREAMERMMDEPPPPAVLAYVAINGRDPEGWPPNPRG
jgi:hypothetical protein